MKVFRITVLVLGILGSLAAFAATNLQIIGNEGFAKDYLKPTPSKKLVNSENGFYAIIGIFDTDDEAYAFAYKTRDENLDIAVAVFEPDSVSTKWRVMIGANINSVQASEACFKAKTRELSKSIQQKPHIWAAPKLNIPTHAC